MTIMVTFTPVEKETVMPTWSCTQCKLTKEGRFKPEKCPLCGTEGTFVNKKQNPLEPNQPPLRGTETSLC